MATKRRASGSRRTRLRNLEHGCRGAATGGGTTAARAHGIDLRDVLLTYLTAAIHAQVSVAVRLVPLGQTDGLKVMAALEPQVAVLAEHATTATLADLGAIAYATDIAQMRHETLEPRIFRS